MTQKRDMPREFDKTKPLFLVITSQYRCFYTACQVEAELWWRLGYEVRTEQWNGTHFVRNKT